MFPDSRKWKAQHFVEDSKGWPLVVHNVITVQVRVFVEVFWGSAWLCLINPGCHFVEARCVVAVLLTDGWRTLTFTLSCILNHLQGFCMVLRFSYLGVGVLNALKFFGLIWSNKCVFVFVFVCVFVRGWFCLRGQVFHFVEPPLKHVGVTIL